MRKLPILAAAVAIALTATSTAQAAYSIIKWEGTGFCQIWDNNIPTTPWPSNYSTVTAGLPTFMDALSAKDGMVRTGTCAF
jgi:hypothetical protein